MPHFVIECSENILSYASPDRIMDTVYDTANESGLFAPNDIKVRIQPFQHYKLGDGKNSFLHVFAYIMEGRNDEQKSNLSRSIVQQLTDLLPGADIISMNISDFVFAWYANKALIDPDNTGQDRHFKLNA